jgi:hypothetical protein
MIVDYCAKRQKFHFEPHVELLSSVSVSTTQCSTHSHALTAQQPMRHFINNAASAYVEQLIV